MRQLCPLVSSPRVTSADVTIPRGAKGSALTSGRLSCAAAALAALAALAVLGPAATASAATASAATASAATASAAGASAARSAAAAPPPASAIGRAYSLEEAGYRASGIGWRFRLARATVKLPRPSLSPYSGGEALSVQLRAADQTVVLAMSATPGAGSWRSAVAVEQKDGQGGCSSPDGCFTHLDDDSPAFAPGDSVTFDLYYNRLAGTVHYTASDSTLGEAFVGWFQDGGELFSSARIGVEFGPDPWTAGSGYQRPAAARALAHFTAVRLTSYHGTTGTLAGTPWLTSRLVLTSTGTSRGTVIAAPTEPASGGTAFRVIAAG
jgi:hypothetical protein